MALIMLPLDIKCIIMTHKLGKLVLFITSERRINKNGQMGRRSSHLS